MIIADTGFWLALASPADQYHKVARSALAKVAEPLVTTWPVITETCHLLLRRLGNPAQEAFLKSYIDGAFQVFDLAISHGPRLVELMTKYRDLPMDVADASLVILAETLGSGQLLSTDQRDFRTYRWKNRRPFKNLLPL